MTTSILQLLRNSELCANKKDAVAKISAKLKTLPVGAPAIASYTDGDVKSILFGIAYDATNYQIFEGAKVDGGGNLELPEEVKTKLDAIQAELDKTQTGAGLGTDGTYTPESGSNYLDGATSLKDADKKLDAAIKAVEENATKVKAGKGIDVQESNHTATVSVKLDPSDKVFTLGSNGLLANLALKYVKATSGTGGTTPAKLQLIGKDNTVITDLDASDFIMDGMLENVELNENILTFTFNTDAGKEEITVDLSNYIDVYKAGNGISISGNTVSAKVKDAEKILKVDGTGLYVDTAALDTQIGDSKYKSALPDELTTPNKHGGLAAGVSVSALKEKTLSQLFDDILFEEINPTIKAPTASVAPKDTWKANGIYEVGAAAPQDANFTKNFNRGQCTVVGQDAKWRAGEKTTDSLTLNPSGGLPSKITLGTITYKYTVNYGQGDELKTSKGNKATVDSDGAPITQNPLPAGSVSATCSIYGTYPYFCNGQSASSSNQDTNLPASVTSNTKLPLQKWTDTLIGAKFASEASTGTRLEFIYPKTKNVTKVEFLNTVSGKWEVFGADKYTTSAAGQQNIQGVQVDYMKLTTTGDMSGALQLRFTVADTGKSLEEPTYNGEPITDEIIGMLAKNSTTVPFAPDNTPALFASVTGNRPSGVAAFAVNFEPGGQAPLDARTLVPTKADLIAQETYSSKNYYKGMTVTVLDDGGSVALYVLKDVKKITDPGYAGWEKIDAKAAKVSAGNGITVSGNNQISAKVKQDDSFLEVTDEGIKTKDSIKIDCGEY